MDETIIQIQLPANRRHTAATFGLIVMDGYVIDAAPIGRFFLGWPIDKVYSYVSRRGGTME